MTGGPTEGTGAAASHGSGPPVWMPASVAAAGRAGASTVAEPVDGWSALLASLERAGRFVGHVVPGDGAIAASGYRHLLVLLALGIDEALRSSDPAQPMIRTGNVNDVLKWGMDCPDALYSGCGLRPGATYRVSGTRGSVRYFGFQIMGGIESTANVVADDLEMAADGTFSLVISPDERPGNWMELSDGATSLVIRQFFYDWAAEVPAELAIECLEAPPGPAADAEVEGVPGRAARLAAQLGALGEFVEESLSFWWSIEEAGRGHGLNAFRDPAARTDIGGAAENVTVWGSWELGDEEALVIEVTPPEALYWSVSLGTPWWETVDYARHQSSLNGHQAVADADGVVRMVVAHRDPGVANWLDTDGHRRGPMIVRWLRAADTPVPAARVVALADLGSVLPAATARLDAAARRATLEARWRGVRRRFGH
jgi:hypothetical protein